MVCHSDSRNTGIVINMLAKILFGVGLVSAGLLLIVLTTIPPSQAGALGILGVFLLMYITLICFLTFCLWFIGRIIQNVGKKAHMIRKPYEFSLKKAYYYSTVISFVPVILIGMQSVGGVGLYEVLLIGIFLLVGCLYVSRRSS